MEHVIDIENLHKSYGKTKAVSDLSFSVKPGELFAFLGVNGAGKSTTLSILCGQLKRDSGSVKVCGMDIDRDMDEIKKRIGVVFQDSVLDKVLTVKDNLRSRASLYGIKGSSFKKRYKEIASLLDIEDLTDHVVGKLSGGQRRRIDIARALFHSPEILILDEPTTGLDPHTRSIIWNVIEDLRKKENMTVLLTTHYMEEAAPADYVVIIDSGKKAASGTPHMLKTQYAKDLITIYGITEEDALTAAEGRKITKIRDGYQIEINDTSEATELILSHKDLFRDYEITKGGMDNVFLYVTGKILGKAGN